MKYKIVLDTNILVTALLSKSGASFRLLTLIDSENIELALSKSLSKKNPNLRTLFALDQYENK
jgi:predicted nucleic acid-binding protein